MKDAFMSHLDTICHLFLNLQASLDFTRHRQQQEKGEIVLSLPLKSGLAEGYDRSAGLTHTLGDG